MRPLRLFLDGFGCYRQPTEADFSDVDFFALTGPTGSGKSTLIDGLCFALYGTVPRWGTESAIAQALAPAASACRVGLVFEAGGKRYAAVRALARDKRGQVHTREARLDLLDSAIPPDAPLDDILEASIEHLAEGPDPVKAKVQEILGLSYKHFTQSVLLPQGRFSDFLQAEPRKRQDLLVELLAFGVYEKIGQRARDRARLAADRALTAQGERDKLVEATAEAEEGAASRVRELDGLARVVEDRLQALSQLVDQTRQASGQATASREEARMLTTIRVPPGVASLAERITSTGRLIASRKKQADDAARAEDEAERAHTALPDRKSTEDLAQAYDQHRDLTAQVLQQEQDLTAKRDAEQAHAREFEAADHQASHARAAVDAARQAHSAYDLAETLQSGQPCPVCLQPVTKLPHHARPPGLQQAQAAADAAEKKLGHARSAQDKASKDVVALAAVADSTGQRLVAATAALVGAPGEDEVAGILDAIITADEVLREARGQTRARLRDLKAAEEARDALAGDEQAAWDALWQARDTVVSLGVPAVREVGLAEAWEALAAWAARQRDDRGKRLAELDAVAVAFQQQLTADTAALLDLLSQHGITDVTDPAKAPAAVARDRNQAENDLKDIRRDREKAHRLDEQIAANREEIQVATELGRLLRATSFERWLCSEALDSLVAEASATLMELSAGQYELDRDDRNDLVVIDFQDAGARRPVHTLSGGETFQASLALALALSRQVVQLSAGLRELNSVFLDEGFGTLDPETLDTVATTLERLAADKDRMVGLVTHVAALAERVPVRFVVSREGATSALHKERT